MLHRYAIMYVMKEVKRMQVMNVTAFRKNLFQTVAQTVRYGEPIHIAGKEGTAVLMSEAEYNDLMATVELCAAPGMQEKIVRGLHTKIEDCLPADKVEW